MRVYETPTPVVDVLLKHGFGFDPAPSDDAVAYYKRTADILPRQTVDYVATVSSFRIEVEGTHPALHGYTPTSPRLRSFGGESFETTIEIDAQTPEELATALDAQIATLFTAVQSTVVEVAEAA